MLGWIGAPLLITLFAALSMAWFRRARRRLAFTSSMRDSQRLRIALAGQKPSLRDRHEAVVTPSALTKPPV